MKRTPAIAPPLACLALLSALTGCGSSGSAAVAAAAPSKRIIVLNGQNEDLVAYDAADPTRRQVILSGGETETIPGPSSVNGSICIDPTNPRRFVMAEDNMNPASTHDPSSPPNHFRLFEMSGSDIGQFAAKTIADFTPTYQHETSGFGCAFLKDGTLLTTDEGDFDSGPGNGQLVMWFPPLDAPNPKYCKLDIAIATAGQAYVDEQDRIHVASAREIPGIFRYPGPHPTGNDAAHGCGGIDPKGSPIATGYTRERFIKGDQNIVTPTGIAASGHGTLYISSVINGVVAEYDANGKFIRRVLQPPKGETLNTGPYSTGTPYGIAVASDGSIFIADLGVSIQTTGGADYANGSGTVRRIRFVNGEPQPVEHVDKGLNFPDGVAVMEF